MESPRRSLRQVSAPSDSLTKTDKKQVFVESDDDSSLAKKRSISKSGSLKKKKKKKASMDDEEFKLSDNEDIDSVLSIDSAKSASVGSENKKDKKKKSPTTTPKKTAVAKKKVAKKHGPRAIDNMLRKKNIVNKKISIKAAARAESKKREREAEYKSMIYELAKKGALKGLAVGQEHGNNNLPAPTPDKALLEAAAEELKECHRVNFVALNFKHDTLHCKSVERSKHYSAEGVALHIKILKAWENNRSSLTKDEQLIGYRIHTTCCVREEEDINGKVSLALMRKDPVALKQGITKWLRVVPNEEIFDYIHEAHLACGHSKTALTYNTIRSRLLYTVSEKDVKNYISTCPVCLDGPFRLPKPVGAKQPIVSSFFRDRFQADLIDFSNNVGIGANGVEYRWCLSLKDHFTRLVYVRPLRTKSAEETSEELSHIFGLLGYPLVFQTDNGSELVADIVVQAIRELHPDCFTVSGQPRNPREQGSIERSHQPVKSVLLYMVKEYKQRNPKSSYTWVQFIGPAMGCINSSRSYGRNSTAPYTHVFVQDFRFPTSVATNKLRSASNPEQLSRVMGDAELTERLVQMGEIGENDAASESDIDEEAMFQEVKDHFQELMEGGVLDQGIFQPGSDKVSQKTKTEVPLEEDYKAIDRDKEFQGNSESLDSNDGSVFQDCADDTIVSITDTVTEPVLGDTTTSQSPKSNSMFATAMTMLIKSPPRIVNAFSDYLSSRKTKNDDSPSCVVVNKNDKGSGNDSGIVVEEPKVIDSVSGGCEDKVHVKIKVEQVKQRILEHKKRVGVLRKGWCEVRPSAALKHATEEVLDDNLKYSSLQVHLDCMFCVQSGINTIPFLYMFDQGYYTMMKNSTRWFESSLISSFISLKIHKHHVDNILYDICPYPDSKNTMKRTLPTKVDTIIVVGWEGHHYGFMEVNVPNRYVLVKDGLLSYGNMRKWTVHILQILKKWKLIRNDNDIVYATTIHNGFTRTNPTTPEGVFEIIPLRTVVQRNLTECGPIACYHAWEVIDNDSKPLEVHQFRSDIIEELLSMWEEFDDCLRVRLRISDVEDRKEIIRKNEVGELEGGVVVIDDDTDVDVCHICNTKFADDDNVFQRFEALPCHHVFHLNCLHHCKPFCVLNDEFIVGCVRCGAEIKNQWWKVKRLEVLVGKEIPKHEFKQIENLADLPPWLEENPCNPMANPDADMPPWLEKKPSRKRKGLIQTVLSPVKEHPKIARSVPSTPLPSNAPARSTRLQSLVNSTVTRSKLTKVKNSAVVTQNNALLEQRQLRRDQMNLLSTRRQAQQADNMMKQYVDHVSNVEVGSYVCVRVDKRDRRVNCSRGILGVVLGVTSNKGIRVMSGKGILSHNGKISVCPPDTYRVLPEFSTVPARMRDIREQILLGNPPVGPQVTKQEVHLLENGSWFHLRCKCKTKCGPACKCVKNQLGCTSGCGCRLSGFVCSNALTVSDEIVNVED